MRISSAGFRSQLFQIYTVFKRGYTKYFWSCEFPSFQRFLSLQYLLKFTKYQNCSGQNATALRRDFFSSIDIHVLLFFRNPVPGPYGTILTIQDQPITKEFVLPEILYV